MSLVFKWCNKISKNEAVRERARTGTWSSTEPAAVSGHTRSLWYYRGVIAEEESSRHDSEMLKSINSSGLRCLS